MSPRAQEGEQRTNALAAIASSFGLGTIIGPAIAPLFIFQPLGLSGPLIVFAAIGVVVLVALILRLPDDTPTQAARGRVVDYPSMGGVARASSEPDDSESARLGWRDARILPWNVMGVVGGHGYAAVLGVIGFLVIDRLGLPASSAQQSIAIVLMAGAGRHSAGPMVADPAATLEAEGAGDLGFGAGGARDRAHRHFRGHLRADDELRIGFARLRPLPARASPAAHRSQSRARSRMRPPGMVTSVKRHPLYRRARRLAWRSIAIWMPLPFVLTARLMVALAFG
jgi:hypothetical protein